MNKNDILQILAASENAELEFKSAKGGLPESFWETFSAFANTNGGIIVLGVKENNGKFISDGLTAEKIAFYKKNFWDCAHNKSKVSATMLTEKDVSVVDVDGSNLLVFRIPRAPYDMRPVYLTNNPFGHTFRRNHEGDYHCTDAEVKLMFTDAQSLTHSFDSQILPNYSIDDIDMPSLRGFRQRFLLKRENHPWNELDDMAFLTKIGAYKVDRTIGDEGFTRAGILMLGKIDSITNNACTPNYFPDYQEKLSIDPKMRWTDRIYPDGTWEANLFQFFYRVFNKLSQALPVPFMLDGITRIEESPAHTALREALVNCLVHASYADSGNILVTRYTDRITMRNPGRMLVSVDDYYAGGYSMPRNPDIQKMFMLLGFGEKAGSGADTIKNGLADMGWSVAKLKERVQPDAIEITLLIDDTKNENCRVETDEKGRVEIEKSRVETEKGRVETGKSRVEAEKGRVENEENHRGENDENYRVENEKSREKIIKLLSANSQITQPELAQKLNLSQKTIEKHLKLLRENGVIRRVGPNKGGHWEIISTNAPK